MSGTAHSLNAIRCAAINQQFSVRSNRGAGQGSNLPLNDRFRRYRTLDQHAVTVRIASRAGHCPSDRVAATTSN